MADGKKLIATDQLTKGARRFPLNDPINYSALDMKKGAGHQRPFFVNHHSVLPPHRLRAEAMRTRRYAMYRAGEVRLGAGLRNSLMRNYKKR